MFDCYWLPPFPSASFDIGGITATCGYTPLENFSGDKIESTENTRVVALNDTQLSALLSALSIARYKDNWIASHYEFSPSLLFLCPDSPEGVVPNYGGVSPLAFRQKSLEHLGEFGDFLFQNAQVFVSELQEQLMVDVRPELNAMVAAQNEMSDDLDAIRIALQQIAADIEAENNSERLEEIANTIGLLVALL